MLLLRQLPASSMSSISSIRFPSFEAITFPSYTSILLSLLASLAFLSLLRAISVSLRGGLFKRTRQQVTVVQVENKSEEGSRALEGRRSAWSWSMPKLNNLPAVTLSLPVSLNAMEKDTFGKGVGLQQKREERRREAWQQPRVRRNGGPSFQTPAPALYQSEPVSMAKMIMSRHTYRRPTGRPPARAATCQISRKPVSSPPSPPPPSETSPSSPSDSNSPSMV